MMQKLLIKIGWRILQSLSQAIWDGFWSALFWAIQQAEDQWVEKGAGQAKKEWVVDTVMTYMEEEVKLNYITRKAVKIFVSRVIDVILRDLNEALGKDWREQVKSLEQHLAKKIPFIHSMI